MAGQNSESSSLSHLKPFRQKTAHGPNIPLLVPTPPRLLRSLVVTTFKLLSRVAFLCITCDGLVEGVKALEKRQKRNRREFLSLLQQLQLTFTFLSSKCGFCRQRASCYWGDQRIQNASEISPLPRETMGSGKRKPRIFEALLHAIRIEPLGMPNS